MTSFLYPRTALGGGLLLGLAALLATPGTAQAQTTTFTYTTANSGVQTYTVPAGITSIRVVATGGDGGYPVYYLHAATVTATLAVTPGEALSVRVGGAGQASTTAGASLAGGFNGGGAGHNSYAPSEYGGGGGGATDLRRVYNASIPSTRTGDYLASRNALVVAGGSGGSTTSNGGGGTLNIAGGGDGGKPNGANGSSNSFYGTGATQTAPGSSTSFYGNLGASGSNGSGGNGSQGGNDKSGGGGGGYYGGGGGPKEGPGGGGSSWVDPTSGSAISYSGSLGSASQDGSLTITPIAPDLTVSSGTLAAPTTIPAGTYGTIIVQSGGVAQLGGGVTVNTAVLVQSGATLYDGCAIISGAGSFTLAAGGTLGICNLDGISSSGPTGAVQVTGARSFSPDASYVYTTAYPVPTSFTAPAPAAASFGPASPNSPNAPFPLGSITGSGLPTQVRNLTMADPTGLSLSQALSVAQVLRVVGSQDLILNGFALTLPSTAAGTALIVNTGTGTVNGTTATMQRYIGQNTSGTGYRQYSSPMSGETLATLATAGYTPNFTGGAAYNSSATPGAVTPFPTVFSYEQGRTATAVNYYSAFDKGWQAATAGTQAMTVGRGYSVNAPGAALVDFTGQPTTGNVVLNNLAYTGADGGWQLLGNPYPAPLDWSMVPATNRPGMNAALYVSQSTGPYAGQYRTYLGGFGDPLIPAGSGFFVRTAVQGTPGSVTLTNANRVTTFGTQPAFGRPAADQRPQVLLTLGNAANTLADDLTVYADAAATPGIDAEYDAAKLPNSTGLNLSAVAAAGQEQAIVGLPALTAATVLPLHLQVPATGTYQLAATPANLPTGLQAYLRDLTIAGRAGRSRYSKACKPTCAT